MLAFQVADRIADWIIAEQCVAADDYLRNDASDVVFRHDELLFRPLRFEFWRRIVNVENPDLSRS